MDELKQTKKTTAKQFKIMMEFLEANPNIGSSVRVFGESKTEIEKKWKNIAVVLNSQGPPSRNAAEWQRVWINFKAKLKRKIADNKRKRTKISLSPLEQRAASFLETNNCVNPSEAEGSFVAVNEGSFKMEMSDNDPININSNSNSTTINYNSNNDDIDADDDVPIEDKRMQLLQKQTETSIKISKMLEKIEKHLDEKNKLKEKMYELKKEKFEMYKIDRELNRLIKEKKFELIKRQLAEYNS